MAAAPQLPAHRPIVLVDIDGTLADVTHRLHHIRGKGKKNWHRFFQAMHKDEPNQIVVDWVKNLAPEYEVVIVSGRPDNYRELTEAWLEEHGIDYSALHMRRAGDRRPDDVVKREILHQLGKDRIAFVIDDRASVCRMWRAEGLRTFQVAEGDF